MFEAFSSAALCRSTEIATNANVAHKEVDSLGRIPFQQLDCFHLENYNEYRLITVIHDKRFKI